MEKTKGENLNYIKTFIIGLGFFTTGLSWALYNSYMPIFLRDYISSSFVIGFVMVLDNVFAIFLYPIIGALSDRIRTKIGRRMPFIVIGIPIAAFFFALLPFDKTIASALGYSLQGDLTAAFIIRMVLVTAFISGMTVYRSPVIALMPDITPDKHRSTANGIINLMGGVGSVFAFFVGSQLYAVNRALPFIVTSIIMVISLILLFMFIKEPKVPPISKDKEEQVRIIPAIKEIFLSKENSALYILLAILLWFMAYQALETWFTTYSTETMVKIEPVNHLVQTPGWEIEISNDNKSFSYKANIEPYSKVPLNKGDTIIFINTDKKDQSLSVILKEQETKILNPEANVITLRKGEKYQMPYTDKYIILAKNGKTLLVENGRERDIRDIQSKYTINNIEKCSIVLGDKFCRNVKENEASFAVSLFGLLFIITSIPAGLLSKKIGRKVTIMIGIVGLTLVLAGSLLIKDIDVLIYVLALGGIFWALININSITMVWEIATNERLGTYTGLYYFFSQAAAVVAPLFFGLFFDLIGFGMLFPVSIGFLIIALILMSLVKKGEYVEKTSKGEETT